MQGQKKLDVLRISTEFQKSIFRPRHARINLECLRVQVETVSDKRYLRGKKNTECRSDSSNICCDSIRKFEKFREKNTNLTNKTTNMTTLAEKRNERACGKNELTLIVDIVNQHDLDWGVVKCVNLVGNRLESTFFFGARV